MCGVAGIVGGSDPVLAVDAVRKMSVSMARRGPDGEGLTIVGNAVLGHCRLAIFDLTDAGAQPMCTPDGCVAVVFNGAIYNFKSLRDKLVTAGFRFQSRTDTEVLLHGYCAWGIEGLVQRLRGMFAFGVWDARLEKLYLVRDRLGVKPLVYAVRNGTLAFASTVVALKAADYAGEVDEWAVADFLRWGFVSDDHCIYKGVAKVPAATIVEWSKQNIRQWQYWVLPAAQASLHGSFELAVEETEQRLLDSVAVRLDADVPIGVLLSGGIDSSLICWAVKKAGADITAYTVGVPGDPWDETAAAKRTAQLLGINHVVLEMSARDTADLDEVISAYAEPFACASALAMLRVSRAVAASAKVLLTGDGGDDLFLGYSRHRHLWLAEALAKRLPPSIVSIGSRWGRNLPGVGPLHRLSSFMGYVAGGLPNYLSNFLTLAEYERRSLLGPRLVKLPLDGESMIRSLAGESLLEKFLDFERKTYFVGEYLTKVDAATMYYGLEARSPFLDHELWEFGSALPIGVRLRHGQLKAILREIVRKRIGSKVAFRRKRGFGVPVQRWIANRWLPLVENALNRSVSAAEGWIDAKQAMAQLRQSAKTGNVPAEFWYLFVFEKWMARQNGSFGNPSCSSVTKVRLPRPAVCSV